MRVSSVRLSLNPAVPGSSPAACLRQTRWDWPAIRYFADIRRIIGWARLTGGGRYARLDGAGRRRANPCGPGPRLSLIFR